MAREYAKVKVNIWADDDFRELTPTAQHLYFMLLTSPTLNMAGVADWRPNRLAKMAGGWSIKAVDKAADELVDARFVVVDTETDEVLIRSFIRHDGILKSPNLTTAMVKEYAATGSDTIREAIATEVARGLREDPGAKGAAAAQAVLKPKSNPSKVVREGFENGSKSVPDQFENGSPQPTSKGSKSVPDQFENSSPILQTANNKQHTPSADAAAGSADASKSSFSGFWELYPKQVAERLARAAWKRATVDTEPETIVAGLRAQLPTMRATEQKFIPNASRWLDEARWTDKPPAAEDEDPYSHLPWVNASGDK